MVTAQEAAAVAQRDTEPVPPVQTAVHLSQPPKHSGLTEKGVVEGPSDAGRGRVVRGDWAFMIALSPGVKFLNLADPSLPAGLPGTPTHSLGRK